MNDKESKRIRQLVQEGKPISRIQREDFPHLNYWDIYFEAYAAGQRSSRGIKRMITSRLNALVAAPPHRQQVIVEEIRDLVLRLYQNHKTNQKRIEGLRRLLGD